GVSSSMILARRLRYPPIMDPSRLRSALLMPYSSMTGAEAPWRPVRDDFQLITVPRTGSLTEMLDPGKVCLSTSERSTSSSKSTVTIDWSVQVADDVWASSTRIDTPSTDTS